MNHFSELRSRQDREILARELRRRHPAAPAAARRPARDLARRLLRLVGARRPASTASAPLECAPANDA